jgi:hypothetical protein
MRIGSLLVAAWLYSVLAGEVLAQDGTTAGEVTTPYPTVENISVVWSISGDDNANGSVRLHYCQAGSDFWRDGLVLRRVPAGSTEGFSWSNQHAGSVFDLLPGTTYELELVLEDPDGGSETRTVSVATRPVPQAPADAVERAVDCDYRGRLSLDISTAGAAPSIRRYYGVFY